MKKQLRSIGLVLGCIMFAAMAANGQVSGVPGDGIPDLYYFQTDGLMAMTSLGPISRPGGSMVLDADGYDTVAVLIAGKDVSTDVLGCDLCDGMNLPQDSATSAGTFTVGYGGVAPNGSSQWIRTAPLQGTGFRGVVGTGFIDSGDAQQPWPADFPPFLDYPDLGLANYGTGLTDADFPLFFDDGTSNALWSVRVAANANPPIYTNVTVIPGIPEPSAGLLGMVGLALTGMIRRRIG
jgi:hypothetical protein